MRQGMPRAITFWSTALHPEDTAPRAWHRHPKPCGNGPPNVAFKYVCEPRRRYLAREREARGAVAEDAGG